MAENSPQFLFEECPAEHHNFGTVRLKNGAECPVFIRLAAAPNDQVLIDIGEQFLVTLRSKPEQIPDIAVELSNMLRDALLREFAQLVA